MDHFVTSSYFRLKKPSKSFHDGEFLLWLSRLRTQHCLCEDAGSIPGLTQWVKDLAMPQAAAKVTDAAQMRCCCSCGTVHIPAAPIQPLAQELPYAAGMAIKTKKKKSRLS